ncbi:hypothetical protein O181_028266 [Austropuccinia psidii MF-1]|uniref:Uncharacterized protein n=1 Tax=Austropuccinia psidii MF-1 TaxID=1389203 RepID=A0A9Q3CNT7_9BASI|nr:hypothetical protein [Austropuccinia psidii MF-1]
MVTLSGPNSMIPNQGHKIQHPFQRRTLQLISLAIQGGYQKTIEGPQPPGSTGVGLEITSGLFQGACSEVIHIKSVFKAASTSILLGQLNWSIQTAINYTCISLGPIHLPLWQLNHTVQFSRWPKLY